MLLHREFENNIAPYVGMLELNKSCLSHVDSRGELQETAGMSFLSMRFPVTSDFNISECLRDDVWGTVTYWFYKCKNTNQVYEIRYRRKLTAPETELSVTCDFKK